MEKDRKFPPIMLAFLLFSVFGAVSYLIIPDTFLSMHTLWSQNNQTYSHGYILLAFVGYALFVDKRWLFQHPSFLAIPLALSVGIVWVASDAVQVRLIQQMLLPVLVFAAMLVMVGLKNSLKALIPVLALYLAIPVSDFLITPLQDLTSFVVTYLLKLQGITAYIEGYDIHLPYGIMRISGGCAGLNYLLAGVCIGIFYSYLNLRKTSLKIWAITLIVIIALVGNWIRVWWLILIGYYSEMESSLVHEHGFFGWVIFAFLAVGYFIYMRKLEAKDTEFESTDHIKGELKPTVKLVAIFTLTLISFAAAPLYVRSQNTHSNDIQSLTVQLPQKLSSLNEVDGEPGDYGINIEGADFAYLYQGTIDGLNVTLAVLAFKEQKQGKELIYFANRFGDGIRRGTTMAFDSHRINAAMFPNETAISYWGYKVGDTFTTGGLETKLSQLKQVFSSPIASAVVLHVSCERYCNGLKVEKQRHSDIVQALARIEVK
ncbi:exosortase [Alteromonas sp. ASW11-130]|uniref:exosortase n=1 Tax=Alteromonas sp. ASW11-130 TaxID=3015775 RepID=UPI002242A061|nr:exosortase [Alteromonas sp. ASW11-130]MCW8091275.1 exosortase [Alteromonas sp. ASW11-130]